MTSTQTSPFLDVKKGTERDRSNNSKKITVTDENRSCMSINSPEKALKFSPKDNVMMAEILNSYRLIMNAGKLT